MDPFKFQPDIILSSIFNFKLPASESLIREAQLDLFYHTDNNFENEDSLKQARKRNIEKEIYDYLCFINIRSPDSISGLINYYRTNLLDATDNDILDRLLNRSGNEDLKRRVLLMLPFFKRSPKLLPAITSQKDLITYLFAEYEVPDFLYNIWGLPGIRVHVKWFAWFILFAQNGSIKRAGRYFKWYYPRRLQPLLFEIPDNYFPEEACVHAFLKLLGGSERDIHFILENPSFSAFVDPTEGSEDQYLEYWKLVVGWLLENSNRIDDETYSLMLQWASLYYSGQIGRANPKEIFKELSLGKIVKNRTYRSFVKCKIEGGKTIWDSHDLDWYYTDNHGNFWIFRELNNSSELSIEGAELAHCVASYDRKCVEEKSAIVSLKRNSKKVITIEYNLRTNKIKQSRGFGNRQESDQEYEVIIRWATEIYKRKNLTLPNQG